MSSNRADAIPARPGTRYRQQAERKRRNILIACLFVFAAIGLLAAAASSVPQLLSPEEPKRQATRDGKTDSLDGPRTGTVVVQGDTKRCEVAKFDNETGRPIKGFKPSCSDAVVLDSRGLPVPGGTVHRLDSISKSFSGKN